MDKEESQSNAPDEPLTNNSGSELFVKEAGEALHRGLKTIEAISNEADVRSICTTKTSSSRANESSLGAETGKSEEGKLGDNGGESPVRWVRTLDLDYSLAHDNIPEPVCFKCGKEESASQNVKLSRCGKCNVASYCSRECQVSHWKQKQPTVGHKASCSQFSIIGRQMILPSPLEKLKARDNLWSKIRFYASPYAIHHRHVLKVGPGCLFVQSTCTLAQLSLPVPVNASGQPMSQTRSILLHYLTLGEYDREVCRDDFEMASVRTELKKEVEEYDYKKEVVYLMRFRCGHVAVGVAPLVPDFNLCKTLAIQYYANGGSDALQLNIDDV